MLKQIVGAYGQIAQKETARIVYIIKKNPRRTDDVFIQRSSRAKAKSNSPANAVTMIIGDKCPWNTKENPHNKHETTSNSNGLSSRIELVAIGGAMNDCSPDGLQPK